MSKSSITEQIEALEAENAKLQNTRKLIEKVILNEFGFSTKKIRKRLDFVSKLVDFYGLEENELQAFLDVFCTEEFINYYNSNAGMKLLMDCTKAHCFLSIYDPDTRDWASRLIGTKKCLKVSNSLQTQKEDSSGSISVSESREKIIEPELFGNLPNEDAVIIYYKGRYIKAEKTYYFKE